MPSKTPKKSLSQPKIRGFTRNLRSKHNSAPGSSIMPDIYEDEEFDSQEELLKEDSSMKEIIENLNEIGKRVETIEYSLFNESSGIKVRMSKQEKQTDTMNGKMLFVSKDYKSIKHDLGVVKALVHKQARQIDVMDSKVVDLTARSMANNIVITGIIESTTENCHDEVQRFLKAEMDIDISQNPMLKVKIAHRLGVARNNKSRAMVAKVNAALKKVVLEKIECLEGRTNINGDQFYVNVQQPEAKVEARRNAKALLRKFQTKYKTAKVELKGDKVYINNEWKRPLVRVPTPKDLYFNLDEHREMNKIQVAYTKPEEESFSSFWAAAVQAETPVKVQRAYNKIRQESPDLDHISVAYLVEHEGEMVSGLVDDKEHGALHKILRAIREGGQQNIVVFIARKFGGLHIGGRRFEIIDKLAKQAILQLERMTPQNVAQPSPPKRREETNKDDQTSPKHT